jgi:hypothetical protein
VSTIKYYIFRIKSGHGVVGGIKFPGTSQYDAERKLKEAHPGCVILDVQVSE